MAQTGLPATFVLGAENTGLAIGYRVLNLDRTTYSAFTTTGVAESIAGTGTYSVNGGVTAPDAGGYITAGTSGTDIAEGPIDPVVTTGIMTYAVETGHTLQTVLRALYAINRGKATADDSDPTQTLYYAPDNSTVRVTHALTDTTRTVS